MSVEVKICGLKEAAHADAAAEAGADYVGVVFAERLRRVSPEHAAGVVAALGDRCRAVGVFVDASVDDVLRHRDTAGFHIAQLQLQLLPFVALGATNVMTRGFDLEETLTLVESERLTCLHGVPTQLVDMMRADLTGFDLSSLVCGFFGGQTLAEDVTRKCVELFPGRFLNIYGSTEALTVTTCDYRRHPDRW